MGFSVKYRQRAQPEGYTGEGGLHVIFSSKEGGQKPYLNITYNIPAPPTPVGGIYIPVDKLELLAPYIGLPMLLAIAITTLVYVKKRKRNTRITS